MNYNRIRFFKKISSLVYWQHHVLRNYMELVAVRLDGAEALRENTGR